MLSISIELVDETSKIASEFLQLRLKDQNNQVFVHKNHTVLSLTVLHLAYY